MEGKIVIIDGVSNSGKTTLCNNLADSDNIIIDQVPSFIKKNPALFNGKQLPPIPTTKEEEISNQKFLLNAEIERLKLAYCVVKRGKNAILDRSFLSTVSVSYSLEKTNRIDGIYLNSLSLFKDYLDFINNLYLENELEYIFLITPSEIVKIRNEFRTKRLSDEWIDSELMNKQNDFFISQKDNCRAKVINTKHLDEVGVLELVRKNINKKGVIK